MSSSAHSSLQIMAAFAAALRPDDLSPAIRAKIRTCLVDTVWGCLQVHHDSRAIAALRVTATGGQNGAHVLTTGERRSAAEAAYVNAAACAATDRSDTHLPTATHPGIIVIPAILAALEERGGSGVDLERGVVVGYEIMGRIARAVMSPGFATIFRPTAVAAPVAAAMAVASALRLDERAIVVAGSLAAQTAIGFNEWARAGTGEHVFHAAVAARNAVTCAYLAAEGAEAAATALDGPSGLLAGYGALDQRAELTRDLGRIFELDQIAFKPAPACFFAQTPIQTAEALEKPIDASEIDTVEIRVTSTAARYPGCAATRDFGSMQAAVMSIPFAVASTLRVGRLDVGAWSDFANAEIAALAARCNVVIDDELTAAYPARSGCAIALRLRDGRRIELRRDDFVSMDNAAVETRFLDDAAAWIGPQAAERTLARIHAVSQLPEAGLIAASAVSATAKLSRKATS